MTTGHAEQMTAILRRVGGALIEATPERWTEATLRVEVRTSAEGTTITHSVKSEQHPRDIVLGTDELFEATRELYASEERTAALSNRRRKPAGFFQATHRLTPAVRQRGSFLLGAVLQLLSDRAGEPWAAFVMRVRQESGDWKFDINFEYPD